MPDHSESLPGFDDLPERDGIDHCAWGLFGADDQVGMFNLQTPERVVAGARLVRGGRVFPLNWELDLPSPPLYGRGALRHSITTFEPGQWGNDDWYDDFYPQASSQWDGLTHVGVGNGRYYNGVTQDQVTGDAGRRNGIEHWARRGIAGRCVLLDVARWHEERGSPLPGGSAYLMTPEELEEVRRAQRVELRTGDVLLLRTGWLAWYTAQDQAGREAHARPGNTRAPGLDSTIDIARYLWNLGVCAVAADNPAVESRPARDGAGGRIFLHTYLLGRFGVAMGEMFDLEALAADCARDGVYEAFFTSAPLNKLGGCGSPPNALAIK